MEEMELAMNQPDHEEPVKAEGPRWYEVHISLEDIDTFIKANMATVARSFIAIGFYLKRARDEELFKEEGYQNIWDFSRERYGLSKTYTSRYMSMNDRFSENGNSPNVRQEYRAYKKGQLQEMLYLEDDQLEQVTPQQRVEDIRGMRKPKEVPYIELPGQMEIEIDFPEYMPESSASLISQKQTFEMSVEDMLSGEGQEGFAISQQEPEEIQELEEVQEPEQESPKRDFFTPPLGCPNREAFSCTVPVENKLVLTDGTEIKSPETVIEEPETVLDHPETVIDGEFVEIQPEQELSVRLVLEEEKKELQNWIDAFKADGVDEWPLFIGRQKIIVAALTAMVAELEMPEPEPEPAKQEQPELPILKNNDQRKEFIEGYTTWPLWIDIKETGERYYRYNLSEKIAMVVKVSWKHPWSSGKAKDCEYGAEQYYLLGVGTEWKSGKNIYVEDETRTFYECSSNMSALVEYLKEFQKKK